MAIWALAETAETIAKAMTRRRFIMAYSSV
jgi:hypothetical protein